VHPPQGHSQAALVAGWEVKVEAVFYLGREEIVVGSVVHLGVELAPFAFGLLAAVEVLALRAKRPRLQKRLDGHSVISIPVRERLQQR